MSTCGGLICKRVGSNSSSGSSQMMGDTGSNVSDFSYRSPGGLGLRGSLEQLPACDYTIDKSLGKGVFGEVFLASNSKGEEFALKRLPKTNPKFDWKLVNREIEVGKRLKLHDGVCKMFSFFETVTNVYLVLEYVDGEDLFTFMEDRDFDPLTENEARDLTLQLVEALAYCHQNRVAHRDVKLDNILLDTCNRTKLIDFGLASMDEEGDHGCQNFVGSPEYVAPEIILRIPYSGFKADVYSLGMVLYCLIFGQFPFIPEERFQFLTAGKPHPELEWPDLLPSFPKMVSKTVKDLIVKMLEVDPDVRVSMEEVSRHPWFTSTKENLNQTQPIPPQSQTVDVC